MREGALIENLRCCYYCFCCLSDVKKSINPALIAIAKGEECFHCLQYSNPKCILHFEIDLIFRAKTFLIPDFGLFYILLGAALCHVNVQID